jgi:hypothetical protein
MVTLYPGSSELSLGNEGSFDLLYYHTRWPWPLKDRDYTLSRRCLQAKDKSTLTFISRSIAFPFATVNNVIRVDKYRCFTVLFSSSICGECNVDKTGCSYVSVFCDDTKLALPSAVIDLVGKQAEKLVPISMKKLFLYSRTI